MQEHNKTKQKRNLKNNLHYNGRKGYI